MCVCVCVCVCVCARARMHVGVHQGLYLTEFIMYHITHTRYCKCLLHQMQ